MSPIEKLREVVSAAQMQLFVDVAVQASLNSPCQSKRGAVIWNGNGLVSVGWNHKPEPFYCNGSPECKKTCAHEAIHAEQMAIMRAGVARTEGAKMLHVKTIDGVLVPSMGPSCLQCSKLILGAGIAEMWLFHQAGWRKYGAAEFHYASGAQYFQPARKEPVA